jgi:hypothetical protein
MNGCKSGYCHPVTIIGTNMKRMKVAKFRLSTEFTLSKCVADGKNLSNAVVNSEILHEDPEDD